VSALLHATVVAIGGRGVALVGRSGAGKSDLALRLIDRGAALVGDDYVELMLDGTEVAAPTAIAGKIEVRGVGIVESAHRDSAPLSLVVDLDSAPERLPEPRWRDLLGVRVPQIALRAFEASAPLKVEHALRRAGLALEDGRS
jgi:serine kinase of HPr protein (carbohydrate metabolism regulator)